MLSKGLGPAWVPSVTKYGKMVDLEGLTPLDFALLEHKISGLPEKVYRECSAPKGDSGMQKQPLVVNP